MYCVLCGIENPEYARFCRKCGKPTAIGNLGSKDPEELAKLAVLHSDLSEGRTQLFSGLPFATVQQASTLEIAEPLTTESAVSVEEHSMVPNTGMDTEPVVEQIPGQPSGQLLNHPISTTIQDSLQENHEYASLSSRFCAFIFDLGVIYFAVVVFYFVLGLVHVFQGVSSSTDGSEAAMVFYLFMPLYMISCLAVGHTTIGLYAAGLEVRNESSNGSRPYPSFGRIVLRETLGRFVSSLFFYAGYWRVSSDPRGQAWLDKMSHTVIVSRTVNKAVKRAFSAFAVLAIFTVIGAIIYGDWSEQRSKRHAAWEAEISNYSTAVQQARLTADNLISTQPQNLDDWKANMVRLDSALDTYDSSIDSLNASLMRGEQEDLFESDKERHQTEVLLDVLKLRKQQSEKQREEANMVIQFNTSTNNITDLESNLRALDSDIGAIDHRASRELQEAGLQ